MKNSFCLIVLFFSLGFYAVAQEVEVSQKKEQKIEKNSADLNERFNGAIGTREKEDGPTAKLSPKKQQSEKLKERITITRSKLEKERLGGELPGDYIAAQEAKIAKMEAKLEKMMNTSKKPIPKKKSKKENLKLSKKASAKNTEKNAKNAINNSTEVIENSNNKG